MGDYLKLIEEYTEESEIISIPTKNNADCELRKICSSTVKKLKSVYYCKDKIVSIAPEKSNILDVKQFFDEIYSVHGAGEIENLVDGVLITLSYFNNEWVASTKNVHGAKTKFWRYSEKKTYNEEFWQYFTYDDELKNNLNKNCTYSFVLQTVHMHLPTQPRVGNLFFVDAKKIDGYKVTHVDKKKDTVCQMLLHTYPLKSTQLKCTSANDLYYALLKMEAKGLNFTAQDGSRFVVLHPDYYNKRNMLGKHNCEYHVMHYCNDYKNLLYAFPSLCVFFTKYNILKDCIISLLYHSYMSKHVYKYPFFFITSLQVKHLVHVLHLKYCNELRPKSLYVDKKFVQVFVEKGPMHSLWYEELPNLGQTYDLGDEIEEV